MADSLPALLALLDRAWVAVWGAGPAPCIVAIIGVLSAAFLFMR
jgi:hypothetical protein